jgi:hypothetical protein
MRSAVDAQSDLAAIGDQDFSRWPCAGLTRSRPAAGRIRPAGRFSTKIALTVPPLGAVIGFITFIASTISSVSPAFT